PCQPSAGVVRVERGQGSRLFVERHAVWPEQVSDDDSSARNPKGRRPGRCVKHRTRARVALLHPHRTKLLGNHRALAAGLRCRLPEQKDVATAHHSTRMIVWAMAMPTVSLSAMSPACTQQCAENGS